MLVKGLVNGSIGVVQKVRCNPEDQTMPKLLNGL